MTFKKGDMVKIKCEAQPGPFDEAAVTIGFEPGVVLSGFVKQSSVEKRGDEAFVIGKIVRIDGGIIEVQLPGSFFTSARGVASLPRAWAESNVVHV
ncbi:MAG: hypothetical protein Q7S58_09175 [Candidatus Binatus sp.]|uniref:hypothetical protein n=1 Tax=Candidatus Binatus sp. TaxID=2811406 RepID=UPI00271B2848|nr:hypothetical protein [Candidatus Binatus sp.]MDO8432566.1 hypothetical protein [Candidatus Binatus sp.]